MTAEDFQLLWDALDLAVAIEEPTVSRPRRRSNDGAATVEVELDEVAQYLKTQGWVLSEKRDCLHIRCPFEEEHTPGAGGETSTTYFLPGTNGYELGHFVCLHAHCAQRKDIDFLNAVGWTLDGFENLEQHGDQGQPGSDKKGVYHLLTAEELSQLPHAAWCVKGMLPKNGLAAIYGPSGSGKSFLVIDLAIAISSGRSWFDLLTKQCPVVYCALEGEGGMAQRVAAYRARHGDIGENIRFVLDSFNLLNPKDVKALARAIEDTGCQGGVTILDTLNRAAPGTDENDSKDMGRIIAAAKDLQRRVGGLVIVVHHTGKDLTKGLRGHSSLLAALDAAIEISHGGDLRSWNIAKSKDGANGIARTFRLEVVELGLDEELDQITSCVIIPDDGNPGELRKARLPRGANQKIAFQAVREMLRNDASFETDTWPQAAQGRTCVRLKDVMLKVRDRLTCAPDQRSRSAQQALNNLVARNYFSVEGDWLWEP